MKMYSKKYLLAALKKEGLPYTYKSLLKYEAAGVIPEPSRLEGADDRIYTEEQIKEIIEKLKNYKENGESENGE